MSISLSKRLDSVDDAKEKWAEKKLPWWQSSISVKSQVCFFKRTQKKLKGRGEKRKCSPVRFHLCLDFRYLIYIEKKPSLFSSFSTSVSLSC